ncbi:HAD-IIB family hydrolase [Stenotrophomonas muris]|uniref:HAD-IIB family hydrolase n=1 Tax=Stenotrophomonas muris TaxID=2963283 RepID=UPI0039E26782
MRLPNAMSDPDEFREFSKVELAILDLDGTLLSSSDDVPLSGAWDLRLGVVNRLKGRGVPLSIATGRAAFGAFPIISAVSRNKDLPFIIYNGGVVLTSSGTILHSVHIEKGAVREIVRTIEDLGASVLTYWIAYSFDGRLEKEWAVFHGGSSPPHREFNGLPVSLPESLQSGAICVAALAWSDDPDVQLNIANGLSGVEEISLTRSGSKYVEIRPFGSSKAQGLNLMLSSIDISARSVMAIGDNDNDIELLSLVGFGVCVSNASDGARAASRFQADYPSTSGAIQALQIVARAKRLFSK